MFMQVQIGCGSNILKSASSHLHNGPFRCLIPMFINLPLCTEMAVLREGKRYGNIGQGVIKYGCHENPPNYLTTLADSIRVADDFGKFRVQYELHEPLIGMHGSFVVCQTAVEAAIGFDHGISGSITEDAYFALVARAEGVKVRLNG